MEKNFNTDNFEQFLREATDDFRMYPAKRVWHGIYNDLHPAKRWPSFAILLLLITSIMYIGVSNSDENVLATGTASTAHENFPLGNTTEDVGSDLNRNDEIITMTDSRKDVDGKLLKASTNEEGTIYTTTLSNTQMKSSTAFKTLQNTSDGLLALNSQPEAESNLNAITNNRSGDLPQNGSVMLNATNTSASTLNAESNLANIAGTFENTVTSVEIKEGVMKPHSTSAATTANYRDESGWMEDFAFRNLKIKDKWKGRMSYQLYVAPSMGFRTLRKNREYALPPSNALLTNPYAPVINDDYSLNHAPAVNLEIGMAIIYNAAKRVRLKAGAQLNYTNYYIQAQELNHPTFTALMLTNSITNATVLSTRSTMLANKPGTDPRYLKNTTYQVSVPIGAEVQIARKDNFQVHVGGTIQPTYIFGGESYLISADMQNYVAENNFLQRYNLNASLETSISYRTKSGVVLNAGPQFRYQLLSTYKKSYTYDEKLYNLGIKLGMTKNF